jgi:hypothetical protein
VSHLCWLAQFAVTLQVVVQAIREYMPLDKREQHQGSNQQG